MDHAQSIFRSYYFLARDETFKAHLHYITGTLKLFMNKNLAKFCEILSFICKMMSYKKNFQCGKCMNPFPMKVRSMAIKSVPKAFVEYQL